MTPLAQGQRSLPARHLQSEKLTLICARWIFWAKKKTWTNRLVHHLTIMWSKVSYLGKHGVYSSKSSVETHSAHTFLVMHAPVFSTLGKKGEIAFKDFMSILLGQLSDIFIWPTWCLQVQSPNNIAKFCWNIFVEYIIGWTLIIFISFNFLIF